MLAALRGSPLVLEEDIFRVVAPIVQHRIKTNFTAQAKGLREPAIIEMVVEFVRQELKTKANRGATGKLLRS